MPLIPLLHINKDLIKEELDVIIDKLEMSIFPEFVDQIKQILRSTLKSNLKSWGIGKSDLSVLEKQSFTKGRMDNNIVDLSENQVFQILEDMYS